MFRSGVTVAIRTVADLCRRCADPVTLRTVNARSSSAGAQIARVDVYVNGRPVQSLDAHKGAVPSAEVAIGKKGKRPARVEVEAWDHSSRLVAFRRLAIR